MKSPAVSSNSSKPITRNYSQQSSDAFPLMKSYANEKSNRAKPLGLSSKIKNSMMDFTDIKYSTATVGKPYLKNSSSMESSETVHSPTGQYDDEEFDTSSTTHGTNNHSDTVESIDELTAVGDYNYDKYQSYSDQRKIETVEVKGNDVDDIEKLRKSVQDEIVQNESFLDEFCDSLSKNVKIASRDAKKDAKVAAGGEKARIPVRANINRGRETPAAKKGGRVSSGSTKKKILDPTKKTELLAQLKAIDGAAE